MLLSLLQYRRFQIREEPFLGPRRAARKHADPHRPAEQRRLLEGISPFSCPHPLRLLDHDSCLVERGRSFVGHLCSRLSENVTSKKDVSAHCGRRRAEGISTGGQLGAVATLAEGPGRGATSWTRDRRLNAAGEE